MTHSPLCSTMLSGQLQAGWQALKSHSSLVARESQVWWHGHGWKIIPSGQIGAAVVASEVTTVVVVPSTLVVVMVTGFVPLLGDDVVVQVG